MRRFEAELLQFVENSSECVAKHPDESITDEITEDLKQVLQDFKEMWKQNSKQQAAPA